MPSEVSKTGIKINTKLKQHCSGTAAGGGLYAVRVVAGFPSCSLQLFPVTQKHQAAFFTDTKPLTVFHCEVS